MTRSEIMRETKPGGGMFAVIPAVVMKDESLSMSAKMLYGIITWKCNDYAYCWYTNREFGEEMGLSPKRISALLSDLEIGGHIEMEIIRDEGTQQVIRRYIYPVVKSSRGVLQPPPTDGGTPIPKNGDTPPQECGDPIPKNAEEKYKEKRKENNTTPTPPQEGPKGGERKRPSKYDLQEDAKPVLRAYVGEDRQLAQALGALIDVRVAKRAINSKRAIEMLLGELDRLSGGRREDKLLLIRQSVTNSWKSVFPLKGGGGPPAAADMTPERFGWD